MQIFIVTRFSKLNSSILFQNATPDPASDIDSNPSPKKKENWNDVLNKKNVKKLLLAIAHSLIRNGHRSFEFHDRAETLTFNLLEVAQAIINKSNKQKP